MKNGFLVLEDGTRFQGYMPSWVVEQCDGEVVFSTGMTGYPESLTDPSYTGQILVFTYPLIGNYGVPPKEKWESNRIQVRAVIVGDLCLQWSHQQSERALINWLEEESVPILTGVDTREVTKRLRERGVMLGAILCEDKEKYKIEDPNQHDLIQMVTTESRDIIKEGNRKVVVIDCGIKENIIRDLSQYPFGLTKVRYDDDFTEEEFDAIFISNGPGDPSVYTKTVSILKKALKKNKPIFGICLGAQLLALAAGGKTYKLQYGHRGQNQPCMHLKSKRCYLTSQNHGYAIEKASLPDEWKVSWENLNDGSVAGIEHRNKPYFAVQFHPEAAPGPTDTKNLFDKFYESFP